MTLIAPADFNRTTNRTLFFTWNASDPADGDTLFSYQINITRFPLPDSSGDNRFVNVTVTNYTTSPELYWLDDYGYAYQWSVRANDSDARFGEWSTPRWFNISSLIIINATVRFMDLGVLTFAGASNNSTTDSPPPFRIQNDGNAILNISINASSLWSAVDMPSQYYRYKARNVTGEDGAFDVVHSVVNFTNVNVTPEVGVVQLNYSDATDSANIDIYVQVPSGEPSGAKSSLMTFVASLGYQS